MLENIEIKRFKHLDNIDISLGSMNLFVGSNNAGKSSVLQAIQFAISAAQTTTLEPNYRWDNNILSTSVAPTQLVYTPLRDVSALAPGGILKEARDQAISVTFVEENGESTNVIVGKGRNKNLTVRITGQSLGERLQNIETPYSIYVPGLAGIPATEEYKTPGIIRKAAAKGDANNVFRNILWLLKQDDQNWGRFMSDLTRIFPNLKLDVKFNPERDESINAIAKYGTQDLPIDGVGTGVLQAVQILSYVNLYRPKMLILDEPDSHLHPNNQRRLAKVLLELAEERDVQILLSTHSRHLIDELSDYSKMHWIREGKIVLEDNYDNVNVLMDIGALDKGDRLLQGNIKYVFLTEDSETEGVRALLESSGFNLDDVDIWSYKGCSKVEIALVLNSFIRKHAPATKVILHRDRDYLSDLEIENFKRTIENDDIHCFITEGTDIESHFLNAEHINQIYPNITVSNAEEIISSSTEEVQAKTIEKFINSRTTLEIRRVGGKDINAGKISAEAHALYSAEKTRYRHGKKVLGCVKTKLHPLVGGKVNILIPTHFVKNEFLNGLLEHTEVN
ncbi:AAA family ATPase [Paenibacillus monticola]|uniref:AAA family ATPase n=1 Tax=Paenibacillus monticola TaxID=2666075 RepID=A0A7X2L5M2_9BACL|nr:AAA family ATPase [Paenibacillus monticola]MRN56856.1 AAA family ATPase [Paenibacillus monticola]